MKIAIDLGGSTVDLVVFGQNNKILQTNSFESNEINRTDLKKIISKTDIKLKDISDLRITGGFSLNLPDKIDNLKIKKIPEFTANGFGGSFLAKTNSALIVSLGTGTSMVKVIEGKIEHIGGTGVGGGTLLGLGKLLLNKTEYSDIDKLAQKGNLKNIDLSVKDIVGSGIGIIPPEATASNFGKSGITPLYSPNQGGLKSKSQSKLNQKKIKNEDVALGLCNLIGETIGSIAYFASKKHNLDQIVLIGKLIRVKSLLKIIKSTSKIYNKKIIVPKMAEFGTAIGAGLYEKVSY